MSAISANMKMPAIHRRKAALDSYLAMSATAECIGALLLQLLAGSVADSALSTSIVFSSILFSIKYVSGGHINPGVSFAALMSGHIDWVRGCVYIAAQFIGAMFGALLQAWMSPFSAVGEHDLECHSPISSLESSNFRVFLWETLATTLFLCVVYAAIFVRPGHGDVSPIAPGLALFAALATGGQFTGGSTLDPARAFATAVVFKCSWKWAGVFISAHLTAGLIAAAWALSAFGRGDHFAKLDATSQLRESLLRGGNIDEIPPAGNEGRDLPEQQRRLLDEEWRAGGVEQVPAGPAGAQESAIYEARVDYAEQ